MPYIMNPHSLVLAIETIQYSGIVSSIHFPIRPEKYHIQPTAVCSFSGLVDVIVHCLEEHILVQSSLPRGSNTRVTFGLALGHGYSSIRFSEKMSAICY